MPKIKIIVWLLKIPFLKKCQLWMMLFLNGRTILI